MSTDRSDKIWLKWIYEHTWKDGWIPKMNMTITWRILVQIAANLSFFKWLQSTKKMNMDKRDCNHHSFGLSLVRSHFRLLALGSSEAGKVLAAVDPKMRKWIVRPKLVPQVSTCFNWPLLDRQAFKLLRRQAVGEKFFMARLKRFFQAAFTKFGCRKLIYSNPHTSMPIVFHIFHRN